MDKRIHWSTCWLAALIGVAGAFACKSAGTGPAQDKPATSAKSAASKAPWSLEFQSKSILIAREITIEGPVGLIDHVAYKQVAEQRYSTKTIPDGLLQEISVGDDHSQPIFIQLDNLVINAIRSARVLERVVDGPVKITARGDAYWKNLETGEQKRAESVELIGLPGPRAK